MLGTTRLYVFIFSVVTAQQHSNIEVTEAEVNTHDRTRTVWTKQSHQPYHRGNMVIPPPPSLHVTMDSTHARVNDNTDVCQL